MRFERGYPRKLTLGDTTLELRLMARGDEAGVLELATQVPEHDRLFMHRDITSVGLAAWVDEIERGELVTVLGEEPGGLLGYASIEPERDVWSRHVAELRVLVSAKARGRGLGRALAHEAFALALSASLEKLTVRMTTDQEAAVRVFEELGFQTEALLREHVRDASGYKHDLLVLGHDVRRFHARLEAYGVTESLSG